MSTNTEILSTRAIVEHGVDIVLLRRASTGEFAGVWELPGGKLEPGEDIATGAFREAREETGLELEHSYFTPQLIDQRIIPDGKHRNSPYKAFGVVLSALTDNIIVDPNEHTDAMWVLPQDALGIEHLSKTSRNALRVLGPLLCRPLITPVLNFGRD